MKLFEFKFFNIQASDWSVSVPIWNLKVKKKIKFQDETGKKIAFFFFFFLVKLGGGAEES